MILSNRMKLPDKPFAKTVLLFLFLGASAVLIPMATLGAPPAKPKQIKPTPKIAEAIRGNFDMSQSPRPFCVFMIMDQKNNMYPSFWCGDNRGGKISFDARIDELDDTFSISNSGSFTVRVCVAARKYGMAGVLPGGEWIEGIGGRPLLVTFSAFKNPVITGEDAQNVRISAEVSGTVEIDDRKAPFSGTADLAFSKLISSFTICAIFPLPGKELGLLGTKGEGIVVTLYTATPTLTTTSAVKTVDDEGALVVDEAAAE